MRTLSLADVTRVATEAAQHEAPGYEVVGVKVNEGEGDYTEVVVRVLNCDREPCVVTVGVFRDDAEATLREAIVAKLRDRASGRRGAQ